ncbi:hypothetical protein [Kitasatospora sp. NPDC004531]
MAGHQIELVFLPTYGSWLHWIKSDFAALRYFALTGTRHRSHDEQNAAIGAHIHWRNARRAEEQLRPDSPIRTWIDCPEEAA